MTPPTHQLAVCMKKHGGRSLFGGSTTGIPFGHKPPPYGEQDKECVHEQS